MAETETSARRSVWSLLALNFFLADVQTGLGPFLAAYLAASGWNPRRVGYALTFGGLVGVAMQTPAGAIIDAIHRKRMLLGICLTALVAGAFLLLGPLHLWSVYAAQLLIGGSGAFLAPAVAAITLGIVGAKAFDRQFGKNQACNSAGNVFAALLVAAVSYKFGYHAIFWVAVILAVPAGLSVRAIDPSQIDYARARGGRETEGKSDGGGSGKPRRAKDEKTERPEGLGALAKDRVLLCFLGSVFLFHLANAAMLPQLGEMLAKGNPKTATSFMSASIIVTQMVIALSASWIGRRAAERGRKPLLLLGFGVLPIRGVLYTIAHGTAALITIQTLDGVANAIFVVVSVLVIKDRTQGTGRFNVAAGALATMLGIGAASSTALGGELIQRFGYKASFLGLAAVALCAFALLWMSVPETRNDGTGVTANRLPQRVPT